MADESGDKAEASKDDKKEGDQPKENAEQTDD